MSGGIGRVLDPDGNIQEHCFQIGDQGGALRAPEPPAAQPAPPPAVATAPVQPTAKKKTSAPTAEDKAPTTRQILSQLRARLRVVEREITARKTLEREREQLRRLIGAAQIERDNLRRLRSAG